MTTKRRTRRPPGAPPTHDAVELRAARERAGMQQKELADAVGISRTFMCEIESGIRTPDLELLGRMADVLDVTVESVKFRGCACGCTCRCHARESA